MSEILLLCTANICRSPMAQALLTRELAARRAPVVVSSAGTLGGGLDPPAEVVAVLADLGLGVTGHRSHQVTPRDLHRADLILGMAREHVRSAVVMDSAAWPRAFTLRELVRRGGLAGPRGPGESLAEWLARSHDGRGTRDLLGDSALDDVPDPIGGPLRGYAATAAQLAGLTASLADLAWPSTRLRPAG